MKKPKKLTARQKLFCDWYLKTMNATEAAIRAKYSKKTARQIGCKLLTKVNIQNYLAQRRNKHEELLGFNKSTILQDLIEIKDRCKQAEPVMRFDPIEREMVQETELNDDGEEVGVYQFDSRGANKAIEQISKMMGYNEPEKIEDVTPPEKKATMVIIHKEYVTTEPEPTTKTDNGMGSAGTTDTAK